MDELQSMFSDLRKASSAKIKAMAKKAKALTPAEGAQALIGKTAEALIRVRLGEVDEAIELLKPVVAHLKAKKSLGLDPALTPYQPQGGFFWWADERSALFGKGGKPGHRDLSFIDSYLCRFPAVATTPKNTRERAARAAHEELGLDEVHVNSSLAQQVFKKEPARAIELATRAVTQAKANRDWKAFLDASALLASFEVVKSKPAAFKTLGQAAAIAKKWKGNFEGHGLSVLTDCCWIHKSLAPLTKTPEFRKAIGRAP